MAQWVDSGRALGVRSAFDAAGRELSTSALLRGGQRRPGSSARECRITAALIVQNEEAVLPRALESLAHVADELVVVDGGSVDRTREVAQEYGARVEVRRFDDDFSAQRNYALDLVRTPWVFMVDADEVVPIDLAVLLRRLAALDWADAVFIPRLTVVEGGRSEPMGWPDLAPRLFRPAAGRYRGRLHEQVLGCRRPIVTPISGPFLMHLTTQLRVLRNSLFYAQLDPAPYSPEWLRWAASEVRALEERPMDGGPEDGRRSTEP